VVSRKILSVVEMLLSSSTVQKAKCIFSNVGLGLGLAAGIIPVGAV